MQEAAKTRDPCSRCGNETFNIAWIGKDNPGMDRGALFVKCIKCKWMEMYDL